VASEFYLHKIFDSLPDLFLMIAMVGVRPVGNHGAKSNCVCFQIEQVKVVSAMLIAVCRVFIAQSVSC